MLQTRVNHGGRLTTHLIQIIIMAILLRNEVTCETTEACFGSQLNLICNETKVIRITEVVLGDQNNFNCPLSGCCIKSDSCTRNSSELHMNDVRSRCNGRPNCFVNVTKEKISCELFGFKGDNDFERITYDCINISIGDKTSTVNLASSTTASVDTAENTAFNSHLTIRNSATFVTTVSPSSSASAMNEEYVASNDNLVAVVVGIIILIVLILIIVIIVIIRRRKTWTKVRNEVEMFDVRNVQSETIYANENQGQNANAISTERVNGAQRQQATTTGTSLYETANSVIEYGVVNHDMHSTASETGVVYSAVDILTKIDDKMPSKSEDDSYSLAGDPYSPKNYDSANKSTNADNIYDDVEPRPADIKAKSQTITNIRDQDKDGKKNLNKSMNPMTKFASSSQNINSQKEHSYANIDSPKTGEGFYKNIVQAEDVSSTSPNYEPMSPVLLDEIYANETVVPFRQESVKSSLGGGSETGSPYCDMRSPSVRFQDDGAQIVVDNDLYSQ